MTHKVLVINPEKRALSQKGGGRGAPSGLQMVSVKAGSDNGLKDAGRPAASPNGSRAVIRIEKDPFNGADQKLRQEQRQQQQQQQFTLSPMRWPMLVGILTYGVCNGIANENNSVLQVYVAALGVSLSNYIYLSQMSFFMPFVASFLTAAFVDQLGVRTTIFITILVVAVRNSARALLFLPGLAHWSDLKIAYWLVQRFGMAATHAMYYCLPLRIAESWFAESERSPALSLLLVAPIVGQSLASMVFPHFIVDLATAPLLAYLNLAAAFVTIAAVTLAVQRSKPAEGAPSARNLASLNELSEQSGGHRESLWTKVKRVLTNSNYLIHLFALNAFDPLVTVLQTILQDIFLNAGLTRVFCGQFLAFAAILAATMQITCSMFLKSRSAPGQSRSQSVVGGSALAENGGVGEEAVRRRKTYDPYRTRTCKILLSLQCATFILFAHTLILHELYSCKWLIDAQWWLIILAVTAYNVVRYSAAPHYNEQCAELICGTISEPVSGACQMTFMTLMYNLSAITFVGLRWETTDPIDHTTDNAIEASSSSSSSSSNEPEGGVYDSDSPVAKPRAFYQLSVLFFSSVALCLTALYLIKFRPARANTSTANGSGNRKDASATEELSSSVTNSPAAVKAASSTQPTSKV